MNRLRKLLQKRRVACRKRLAQKLKVHIHAGKAAVSHLADRVPDQSRARRFVFQHRACALGREAALLGERGKVQQRRHAEVLCQRAHLLVVRADQLSRFRKAVGKRRQRLRIGKNPAQHAP